MISLTVIACAHKRPKRKQRVEKMVISKEIRVVVNEHLEAIPGQLGGLNATRKKHTAPAAVIE